MLNSNSFIWNDWVLKDDLFSSGVEDLAGNLSIFVLIVPILANWDSKSENLNGLIGDISWQFASLACSCGSCWFCCCDCGCVCCLCSSMSCSWIDGFADGRDAFDAFLKLSFLLPVSEIFDARLLFFFSESISFSIFSISALSSKLFKLIWWVECASLSSASSAAAAAIAASRAFFSLSASLFLASFSIFASFFKNFQK